MNRLALCSVIVVLLTLASCSSPPNSPDPAKPAVSNSPQASATTAPSINYGREVARRVDREDEIISVLENGMTVIARRIATPAVAVRGYVWTGGVYEGQWLGGGLSHLLEHLVAGPSNQRRTEAENRDLLQSIGNNSNASTYPDHTAFYVTTTAENLDKAADLVTGWMLGAKITPAEYAREYEVVQRELELDKGNPDWVFYYQTVRNRYRVSPARVPVIGYQEVIQGLSRDDVYAYYKKAYRPNNMVFVITGNLDPEVMLKAVQKNVAAAPPGRVFSHDIESEPPVEATRILVSAFPKLGQAKLQLAFPTIKMTHPDLYALDVLASILGRGESSILIQEIRDQRQLVSSLLFNSDTPSYVEGTLQIDMELDADKLGQATAAVLEQIERIKTQGVTEDRLARAKTQLKTRRAFSQQTAEDIADTMAVDLLDTGDPHFSDRYVERVQLVTADQVKAVAAKYLLRSRLLTTAMLPEESAGASGLAQAEKVLRSAAATTQPTQPQVASAVVKVELNNNLTLLIKRVPTAPIVTMSMYGLGGLSAEDAKTNGLGNLAMTTAPRGTKTRSAQQIAEFFDSVGGTIATASSYNYWTWSAQCLKDDFPKTLDVFSDIVANPTFPDTEVAQMKKRTLAAIESQDADWFNQALRFFRKAYFGPLNSSYQFMAIGDKQTVEPLTPQQVRQWYTDQVLTSKRVLAIYGDIDVEKARSLAVARFGGEKPAQNVTLTKSGNGLSLAGAAASKPSIQVERVEINKSDNPQTAVLIGFDCPTLMTEPNFAVTVARTMAAGFSYPTGYIFDTLRGEGLVYDAGAFPSPGRDAKHPGTLVAYAGCDPKNVNRVVDALLENIARLQGQPQDLQPEWFERAKKLIITADALNHEKASAQAEVAALDELFGLGYDFHAKFADKINAVQITDVSSAARRLLSKCVVTINTNEPRNVAVKPGLRTYSSFRPVDLTPHGVQHDAASSGK